MEELFMQTALVDLLSSLPTRPIRQELHLWTVQKEQRRRTSTLLHSLGRGITAKQAERLDALNLSKAILCGIRAASTSDEEFQRVLQKRGVRSKPQREADHDHTEDRKRLSLSFRLPALIFLSSLFF